MTLSATALVTLVQAKAHLRVDAAASLRIDAEFVATADGIEDEYDLDHIPIEGSLKLYVNSVLSVEGTNYTISGLTITFLTIPLANRGITASYDYAADDNTFESYDDELLENLINAVTKKAEDHTGRAFVQRVITEKHIGDGTTILRLYRRPVAGLTSVRRYHAEQIDEGDGSTVAFTLNNTPVTGTVKVYKNGALQTVGVDYTVSGTVITFVVAPADGARISANYNTAMRDYTERLSIGRLNRMLLWAQDYIYDVVYTAGYGADRPDTQALIPDAVTAVLLMVAYLYENRTDMVHGESISGVGSVTYELPLYVEKSGAKQYLEALRVNVL